MKLSASQRINLIKEITSRLTFEEWYLVDLTLKQFGFPVSDMWSGDRDAYIVQMLSDGMDLNLIDLAQHVGFNFYSPHVFKVDPPFWKKGMFRIFISHLATHREFAAELQEHLFTYGISAFVAHNDIEPTSEWQTQIETALATCDSLIALLHKNFHQSNWTDQEIGVAIGRGVPTYAIKFDQDPYGFIGRFQAFNGNNKTPKIIAAELFDSYRLGKQTQQKFNDVLINIFEDSSSYSDAIQRVSYLEKIEVWDPSFTTRIKAALKNNSQIYQAFKVPEKVKALIEKWK